MRGERPKHLLAQRRRTIVAMHVGWLATLTTVAVLWIDHATANELAAHIRAGYPHYSPARVDSAATVYMIYLSVVGAIELVAWFLGIRAVRRDSRWMRPVTTVVFLLTLSLAATDLLIRDTSGDTGLPALLGWIGMLPCLPGLAVVLLMWSQPPRLPLGGIGNRQAGPGGAR